MPGRDNSIDIDIDIVAIQTEIKSLLGSAPLGLSEHAIMRHLDGMGLFAMLSSTDSQLRLFQKHFLVMHALYDMKKLQPFAWKISPLQITYDPTHTLDAYPPESRSMEPSSDHYLQSFYLDWQHFESATEQTVQRLMEQFWEGFYAWETQGSARKTLGVEVDCQWREVVSAYRKKAQQHHPDRGGDPDEFKAVQDAFDSLRKVYRR